MHPPPTSPRVIRPRRPARYGPAPSKQKIPDKRAPISTITAYDAGRSSTTTGRRSPRAQALIVGEVEEQGRPPDRALPPLRRVFPSNRWERGCNSSAHPRAGGGWPTFTSLRFRSTSGSPARAAISTPASSSCTRTVEGPKNARLKRLAIMGFTMEANVAVPDRTAGPSSLRTAHSARRVTGHHLHLQFRKWTSRAST